MAEPQVSVQFWPWHDLGEMRSYGHKALDAYPFDYIWAADEFLYEDSITLLGVLAMELDTSVGTLVTFPWRNPLELAQRFASMAKLSRPGRGVALGIGAGGAVQMKAIREKTNPIAVVRESLIMLRGLLGGHEVDLADFPLLAERFRGNTEMHASLHFPPPTRVPVYLAAARAPMARLAGQHADGVAFSQLSTPTSSRAVKRGLLTKLVRVIDEARAASGDDRPFDKIYNLTVSISRDGDRARQWAKRNTSYGVAGAFLRYPEILDELGLDREECGYVAEAYTSGLGLIEATKRVSDSLLLEAGQVIAGTPDEVVPRLREVIPLIRKEGINHFIFGVPLGPDVPEALELLGREVIPAALA